MLCKMIKRKVSVICALALLAVLGSVYTINAPENSSITEEQFGMSDKAEVSETISEGSEGVQSQLNFAINPDDSKYVSKKSSNIGWGFKKEKGKSPLIDESTIKLFDENNTYYIDNRGGKVMYLTFDEGYENGYTAQILDVLKEKNVQAAFFITGPYLSREAELVDRMVNEGHIVGNHTVNHPNLAKSELSVVTSELKGLNDTFYEKYGKDMVYMRPPEGEYSEKLLCFAGDMGYKTILWSFAYRDWDVKTQKGPEYALSQVTPYFHDGAILLLHAVSSDNASALGAIIDCAREQGYEFKSLDYLFED